MNPDELIGGHAPGNLTPEEKRKLYRAALTDQTVFDALMEEEPLRELLADPESRGYVRAALEEAKPGRRPAYGIAAALAALVIVAGSVWWRFRPVEPPPEPVAVAKPISKDTAESPPVPAQPVPAPPLPAPLDRKAAAPKVARSRIAERPAQVAEAENRLEEKAEEAPAPAVAAALPPPALRVVRVGEDVAKQRFQAGERILLRLAGPVAAGQMLIAGGAAYELRQVEKEWEAGPIELRKGEFVAVLSAAPQATELAKSIRQRAAGSLSDGARPGSPAIPALIRFTVE